MFIIKMYSHSCFIYKSISKFANDMQSFLEPKFITFGFICKQVSIYHRNI